MNDAEEAMQEDKAAANECDEIIREHLKWQNELEIDLGDTLDVKTSIALVIIIFLATQSGSFLATQMPRHWHNLQIASAVCLIIAGVLAVLELRPRVYGYGQSPATFLQWVDGVRRHYKETSSDAEWKAAEFIRKKQIEQMEKRFAKNSAINERKSTYTVWSLRFTVAALITNLATLAGLMSRWRF